MRALLALFALAFVAAATALAKDEAKAPRKKAPGIVGIRWEADLEAGLARAAREGRPILFAVNALEDEGANIQLATRSYPSAAWGEATRGFVCFVGNPNVHPGPAGTCARYPGIPCTTHQAVLKHIASRFGSNLISPQHIILEPDLALAYRKEYYTHVVTPTLLETWLSAIAPDLALSRAGIAREKRIEQVLRGDADARLQAVEKWIADDDGLAAAGVCYALEDVGEDKERAAWIDALGGTPHRQAPVLELMAEDHIAFPSDAPAVTLAWVTALCKVDRALGRRAAARALSRTEDAKARGALLKAWLGGSQPVLDRVAAADRFPAWEALALAGDKRGAPKAGTPPKDPVWRARLQRAFGMGGFATGSAERVDLAAALEAGDRGPLRRALLDATAAQVTSSQEAIEKLLADTRWLGLRSAAAIALTRAGIETRDGVVVRTLAATLFDAVEGPDVRRELRKVLGEDPGTNIDEWVRMLRARVKPPKDPAPKEKEAPR